MTSYEVSKLFYDMFFSNERTLSLADWLNNSLCEEIGDINLEKDNFKSLYHLEGKYFTPITDGTYKSLYNFIIHHSVHPDDVKIFTELMDPAFLKERQENSKTPNFRFAQFRYRLSNGSWRWVEQCILSGRENGIPDNVYRFYVFDIENMLQKEYGNSLVNDSFIEEEKNALTGVYNERHFFSLAQSIVDNNRDQRICLIKLDIQHFKFFDEWYGREKGNDLLKKIGAILRNHQKENTIAGYLGQDDFCMALPFNMEEIRQIYEEVRNEITSFGFSFGFNPGIGVVIATPDEDITYTFDKATIAASEAKKSSQNRIVVYSPELHTKTDNEFKVISAFMKALQNNQIVFYLQPQCRISTKKIVGAEALTRWIDNDGKVIPPLEFIPVLEKYGFITDLDKYIWDKVAQWLKSQVDKGANVVPVSVNVSQVDIYNIDIVEFFDELIKKYHISPKLLKIEITESSFAEDTDLVISIITALRERGFLVMMDDFGSGYSSLNMLSNINFDVIKLDSSFFKSSNNINEYRKTLNVLGSIINMTKLIAVPIIVEGIERQDQCEFLQNLGVRYIQGYYFYKPMPLEDYEKLMSNSDNVDNSGFVVKRNEQFRIREFLDKNIYSDAMLNNVIGPVAIYSYKNNSVDIVRFNQQFYESVGVEGFHDRLVGIEQFVPDFDRKNLFRLLEEAKKNSLQGSKGSLRFYRPEGSIMTYIMNFWYLGEQEGADRYYGSANNVTDYANLQQQMRLISKYASSSIAFYKRIDGKSVFTLVAHGLESVLNMNKETLQKELSDESFYKRIDNDELMKIKQILDYSVARHEFYSFDFSAKLDDGNYVRLEMKADPILDDPISGYTYVVALRAK